MKVERTEIILKSDMRRVLLRPFNPTTEERNNKIIKRILSLSEQDVQQEVQGILSDFKSRHHHFESFVLDQFKRKWSDYHPLQKISMERKLLIGAYFGLEYSVEAAALFNPSLIWHPDQSGISEGCKRFIISLRATGEGHVSSITFRTGIIEFGNKIKLDKLTRFINSPEVYPVANGYNAIFSEKYPISEHILFPYAPEECNGMEDARFVEFVDDSGKKTYYATYTAYNGCSIHSMLLETHDFYRFKIRKLNGAVVDNKGLALFPRKINGHYVMLSRQDNENNYIMFSEDLYRWDKKLLLMEPRYSWEFFQIGNCGCPIETERGWLVLSHGVGAMRKYVISAFLLNLENPTKVIGRLKKPLLEANESEREGYVPNVVYTCGAKVLNTMLIIPYAMSDYAISFATVKLDDLLENLMD